VEDLESLPSELCAFLFCLFLFVSSSLLFEDGRRQTDKRQRKKKKQ